MKKQYDQSKSDDSIYDKWYIRMLELKQFDKCHKMQV